MAAVRSGSRGRGEVLLNGVEFQLKKMKKFWGWRVVMVAQQHEHPHATQRHS
jgi:hypothetical protein